MNNEEINSLLNNAKESKNIIKEVLNNLDIQDLKLTNIKEEINKKENKVNYEYNK